MSISLLKAKPILVATSLLIGTVLAGCSANGAVNDAGARKGGMQSMGQEHMEGMDHQHMEGMDHQKMMESGMMDSAMMNDDQCMDMAHADGDGHDHSKGMAEHSGMMNQNCESVAESAEDGHDHGH